MVFGLTGAGLTGATDTAGRKGLLEAGPVGFNHEEPEVCSPEDITSRGGTDAGVANEGKGEGWLAGFDQLKAGAMGACENTGTAAAIVVATGAGATVAADATANPAAFGAATCGWRSAPAPFPAESTSLGTKSGESSSSSDDEEDWVTTNGFALAANGLGATGATEADGFLEKGFALVVAEASAGVNVPANGFKPAGFCGPGSDAGACSDAGRGVAEYFASKAWNLATAGCGVASLSGSYTSFTVLS